MDYIKNKKASKNDNLNIKSIFLIKKMKSMT